MKHQTALACTALAVAMPMNWSTVAIAQEAAADDESEDVIVIQARKRDERISEVPIAVNAISEDQLRKLTIQSGIDLVREIPSATFVNGGPEYLADISIRGQGAGRQGFSESATGIYRNGTYIAGGGFGGRSFNRLDLFDVSSVETYRGPQSAIYGRNAVGGAVNIISNEPAFQTEGRVTLGYEDVDRSNVEVVFNTPLNENIAVRLGGYHIDRNDGFYTDENTGAVIDKQTFYGARGAVRALLGPRTEATLTVEHRRDETPSFSILGERLPIDNGGVPIPGVTDPSEFVRNADSLGRVEIDETTVFLNVESDLDFADLVFAGNYKVRDAERFNDDLDHFLGFQGVAGTAITVGQQEDFDRIGGEIRLISKPGQKLQWLLGADFQSYDDEVGLQNDGTSFIGGLAALATRTETFTEELTSYSVFAQAEYPLTERLTASVEARVITDQKDFVFVRDQQGTGADIDTGDIDEDETRFLPAVTLDYEFESYGIAFFRFATGYRPFGFNTGVPDVSFVPYDGEITRSYELGWKGEVLDGAVRYGLTSFLMQTEDAQLVSAISETDTTTALQNVDGTTVYGVELELDWSKEVGPGLLSGSLNASSLGGQFDQGSSIISTVGGVGLVDFELGGARVPRTRDYIIAFNTFYTMPITPTLDGFFGGSVQAENGGYENAVGDSPTRFDETIPNAEFTGRSLDGFVIGNIRAGVSTERWTLSGYVRNVGDEVYVLQNVLQNNFYNEPRKYGVELTFRL
mgnify:FL=1